MSRSTKQTIPLKARLSQLAKEASDRAKAAPPGAKREALVKAARMSEAALQIQQFLLYKSVRSPIHHCHA